MRRGLFATIDRAIDAHNKLEGTTYTLGHNHFSDFTDEEFENMLGGRKLAH
jgi:hypothetical protein